MRWEVLHGRRRREKSEHLVVMEWEGEGYFGAEMRWGGMRLEGKFFTVRRRREKSEHLLTIKSLGEEEGYFVAELRWDEMGRGRKDLYGTSSQGKK